MLINLNKKDYITNTNSGNEEYFPLKMTKTIESVAEDKDEGIEQFYFPLGKPEKFDADAIVKKLESAMTGKQELTISELGSVAKACGLPFYWRSVIFQAARKKDRNVVTKFDVITMWIRIASSCHDSASRFVAMLAKPGFSHLEFDDFQILIQDVVNTHPGLAFLRHVSAFHTRYMSTVIARIFYSINRSWSGRISIQELRRGKLLAALEHLESNDDINTETNFFSYEHFYVIYCKFWELDSDHDLVIGMEDLAVHERGVISSRIIERILSGAVTRWNSSDHFYQRMSYVDFVWFLISEEDKTSQTSIEYWFRCMDVDGDGRISLYELEYFYDEQMKRLHYLNISPISFEDCVCQVFDFVNPLNRNYITLRDLKKSKMAAVFFDTFINIEKYLMNEKKDPFNRFYKDSKQASMSEWDLYAKDEYEYLLREDEDE